MATQLALPFEAPARPAPPSLRGPKPTRTVVAETPPAAAQPVQSRRRQLTDRLAALVAEPVRVVMHDNRSVMLTGVRRDGVLQIRMHHMFLDADEQVLRAVARFAVRPDARSRRVVDDYIEQHGHLISAPPRDSAGFVSRGQHHDLQPIFDRLNAEYFDGRVVAEIGYGEAGSPRGRRRRAIKLGSYDDSARRITIHPALDQAGVPDNYVAYIVFHEMLHQLYPARRRGTRLEFHGAEFRQAERAYRGRRQALLWYREHEDLILRYRAPGTPPARGRRR